MVACSSACKSGADGGGETVGRLPDTVDAQEKEGGLQAGSGGVGALAGGDPVTGWDRLGGAG